jgi:predicted aspartyl protease
MRIVIFIASALVCTFLAGGFALAEEPNSCQLKQLASLDLAPPDGANVAIVNASVDGQTAPFIVDTGGTFSALTYKASQDMGMRYDNIPRDMLFMANGSDVKYVAYVKNLVLGKLTASHFPFIILPSDWTKGGASGTLAPDILANYDIEFDFAKNKMNIISPDHCQGQVVYWTKTAYVALPLRLNKLRQISLTANVDGTDLEAKVDTGASLTYIRADEAEAILGRTLKASDRVPEDQAPAGFVGYRVPFKTLTIGGIAVQNPDILVLTDKLVDLQPNGELHNDYRNFAQMPPLLIGMSLLRKLHLYIAYKEEKLYVTGAGAN